MQHQEMTLTLSTGLRVATKSWGAHHERKMLAVHGWLDNASSFDALARVLGQHMHVVAVDLPGHGRSEHKPLSCSQVFIEWLDDLDTITRALGWSTWVQLGHSMGASISLLWAGTFPQRVEHLIVLEGLGPLTADASQVPTRLAEALLARRTLEAKPPRVMGSLEEAVTRMKRARMSMRDADLHTLAQRGTRETPQGLEFSHDTRLQGSSMLRLTQEQVDAFFSRIQAPTLVIKAQDGWPVSEEFAQERLNAMGTPQTATIPGGHHAHMEHPQAALDVILPFLGIKR